MSSDTQKQKTQEHDDVQESKKRKKRMVALATTLGIIALALVSLWAFAVWVGDFLGVDEDPKSEISEILQGAESELEGILADVEGDPASEEVYSAIFDDYSQRLVAEQADLSSYELSSLAEEGVVEMTQHFLATSQSPEEEDLYHEWARELLFFYEELTGQMESP